jgi:hypothetical protein
VTAEFELPRLEPKTDITDVHGDRRYRTVAGLSNSRGESIAKVATRWVGCQEEFRGGQKAAEGLRNAELKEQGAQKAVGSGQRKAQNGRQKAPGPDSRLGTKRQRSVVSNQGGVDGVLCCRLHSADCLLILQSEICN